MVNSGAVWALGAMSGTSLDGVDAAMVLTDGERIVEFGPTAYRPYTPKERAVLRAALGLWPGAPAVQAAAEVVEAAHADLLVRLPGAALVGFHGQTLAHDPGGLGTHQTGSGATLAGRLGLPVVWDFRSADVAAGGQGAPLVPFFHFACAKAVGATQPLAILNLGGVGNVTWIDPRQPAPEVPGAVLAFDTGPANAPINDLMQARLGRTQDEGGTISASGVPDEGLLAEFLTHPYFARMPPKSLDRNTFAAIVQSVGALADADAAATLCAAAARAVGMGAAHFPTPVTRVLVTGGGRHNATLMEMLARALPAEVQPVEACGLNGDMLEAQAFAFLAVRIARGLPISGPSTTGVPHLTVGGRISRPEG